MKLFTRLVLATALAIAATAHAEKTTYRIAAMPFGLPEYMSRWTSEMREHPLVKEGTVKLTVLDGKFDAMVQSNQMDTMITQKFDTVIFAPIDYQAAAAPIGRAAAAKIPVVGSVTRAGSDKLFAYIGTNDVEGGKLETEHLADTLNGKGNVVILEGPIGNSPQLLRREGIDHVLTPKPGIKVLASKTANWERGELDVIGLGRPIIADPEVPKRILSGEVDRASSPEAALHPLHLLPWNNMQLERLADGLEPDLSLDGADAVAQFTEPETRNMSLLLQHRA